MTTTTTHAEAAEFLATEIAWIGCVSKVRAAQILGSIGYAGSVDSVLEFGVEVGAIKSGPIGYTATKRTNAAVFGRKFAEWVAS